MYASQHWADHLGSGSGPETGVHSLADAVRNFINHRVLYWIEVFSVKDRMSSTSLILRKATNWAHVRRLSVTQCRQMANFAYTEI
jgi:hypothetical protein